MRDNTRKQALRHLPAVLAVALAIVAAPRAIAQTTDKAGAGGCTAARATLGEKGLPTPEISTEQMEVAALWSTLDKDGTAVVIDARDPAAFQAGSLPGARNVRFEEVAKAKDDGRLPMLDHNTRIFAVGKDSAQALAAAQEIARNAF